ncbi:hypothetical protein [Microvenator marinus]|uniref:globin domain-containing protein n=1 Tax=Microvenator marinus TaxID=2600177 RepID=UPI00201B950C|nr:hypothetical protein [Microvenator marinus]
MWNLIEEVGEERLIELVTAFYTRASQDMMIGFFFDDSNIPEQVVNLIHYMDTHIGRSEQKYRGSSIRKIHQTMPILPGHFDRRHQILKDVLEEYAVPAHVRKAWLDLDLALRDNVIKGGARVRDELLG